MLPGTEVCNAYDGASRCTHVKYHANNLPLSHGMRVTPSGLRPSLRKRPVGSRVIGMCAAWKALRMTVLQFVCRACRDCSRGQTRACKPRSFATVPHTQECVEHTWAPSHRTVAMWNSSADIRRPRDAEGKAFSQAPAQGQATTVQESVL